MFEPIRYIKDQIINLVFSCFFLNVVTHAGLVFTTRSCFVNETCALERLFLSGFQEEWFNLVSFMHAYVITFSL